MNQFVSIQQMYQFKPQTVFNDISLM